MAAHEARAHLLAEELVEKFLLVGDREMAVARPEGGVKFLSSVAPNAGSESSENTVQSEG